MIGEDPTPIEEKLPDCDPEPMFEVRRAKFVGIDSWNRPVFKIKPSFYVCCTEVLYSYGAQIDLQEIRKHVLYDKDTFDGEPGFPVKDVEVYI